MKRIITLIVVVCAILTAGAQSQINASFTQQKTIKASGKSIQSKGTVNYQSPETLKMNYTTPAGDFFIIEGSTIKMNMNGKKSTIDVTKNATMKAQKNTLLNCIKGNYKQVATDNNAECSVKDSGSNRIVTITAKKAATRGYSKITVTYRKSDNMVVDMVMEEFNGNKTHYTFSNISVKK
ncbi:MAG: outer membrane lipoprotein carrier protein LolA [Bacteroidales bacterium]|nr:outer membrane lipoprotein carrier protein LolA [Bacteroidales bacterium]